MDTTKMSGPLGPDGFTPLVSEGVENARRAEQAERRAEDAEAEVERLRDLLRETLQQQPFRVAEENRLRAGDAEAVIEATRDLLDGWEHDGHDDYAVRLLIKRVRETLALGERFRTSRECER